MATSLSSKKRIRQNEKRRLRNRRRKADVKDVVRAYSDQIDKGDAAAAGEALKKVYKTIDQVAAKGTIHKKTAARRKSRLAKKLNALAAASA